jgi:hypothetical protein
MKKSTFRKQPIRFLAKFLISYSTVFFGILSFVIPISVATHKFGFKPGSFSTPLFFYGDEFFGAAWINSLIKSHSLINQNFGYPMGQNFNYAFVSQDTLPHIFAAIIGAFQSSPYFGLNVYMLLTFGLVGVSFFIAAKMLQVSNWVAAILGISVSLLPQHFSSSTQAITVISYFAIPVLIAKVTLQLSNRNSETKVYVKARARILWAAFFSISGMLYSYYSIGTIVILGTVAIVISLIDGSLKAIKSVSTTLIGTLCGFLLVAVPSLIYVGKASGGVNYYYDRSWQAAYANSGSLIQSISPSYGTTTYRTLEFLHKNWITTFDQLKGQINSYGIFQEGWVATIPLGLIFLYFIVLAFLGNYSKVNRLVSDEKQSHQQIYILGCVGLVSLLWMWAGGLGTFFAMFVSETLRGYSRFSVYAVSALALGAAVGVTKLHKTRIQDFIGVKFLTLLALILFVGDGLTITTYSQPSNIKQNVREIQNVTSVFPKNCKVLQFPVVHFPYESPGWPGYALMAPGLVGKRDDLKWSSGLVGGSPAWTFLMKYRDFQNEPSKEVINLAKKDGFCAILVDENVWETFYDFMPTQTYTRIPSAQLADFLDQIKPYTEYKTTLTTYYLHLIQQ